MTSSISKLKSNSSCYFIGTGVPPAKLIIDSYIGNPGFGYKTSSPGSINARAQKNIIGFPPGVTTTFSEETGILRVEEISSAILSLSSDNAG